MLQSEQNEQNEQSTFQQQPLREHQLDVCCSDLVLVQPCLHCRSGLNACISLVVIVISYERREETHGAEQCTSKVDSVTEYVAKKLTRQVLLLAHFQEVPHMGAPVRSVHARRPEVSTRHTACAISP
eukprot:5753074-Pleurochrysis_carterae.AAC.5